MRGVRIPHELNGEDQFILGLSVTRLAALALGLLAAYTILHLSLPGPLQLVLALCAVLLGAAIAWIRPEGRSLIHWALAASEFKVTQHLADESAVSRRPSAPSKQGHSPRPRLSLVAENAPSVSSEAPGPVDMGPIEDEVIELPDSGLGNADDESANGDGESAAAAPVYLGGRRLSRSSRPRAARAVRRSRPRWLRSWR